MLDVVANHVGPVGYDYSSIIPFNQQSYYHNCNPCPSNSIFLFFDKLYFKVVVAFKIFLINLKLNGVVLLIWYV